MKRLCALVAAIGLLWTTAGCSIFTLNPRVARIQIKGLNNQTQEYLVVLDDPTDKDLDIHLSDRYAIGVDLLQLWDDTSSLTSEGQHSANPEMTPLTPWMTYKYRF